MISTQSISNLRSCSAISHDPTEIAKKLLDAFIEDYPVHLLIGEELFDTRFMMDPVAVEEHLHMGYPLEIAPLLPPVGNIKIRRTSDTITLQLNTETTAIKAETRFVGIEGTNLLLDYPKKLFLREQQRSTFRVKVESFMGLKTTIIRASGITFPVQLDDISAGGMRFHAYQLVPRMAPSSRFSAVLSWPKQETFIRVNALLIQQARNGLESSFRCRFLFKDQKESNVMSALVSEVQRKLIERRQSRFGSPLNEKPMENIQPKQLISNYERSRQTFSSWKSFLPTPGKDKK